MPTQNPRLSLTLTPDLAWQLRRLSELTGTSQSSLITSMLEGSNHFLWRLITTLEAAEEAKGRIPGHVANLMNEAQQRIEEKFGLTEVLDKAQSTRRTAGDVEAATGRPAAAAAPLSNRGVRLKAKEAKKPTESRG
jgi:hypothetical protein